MNRIKMGKTSAEQLGQFRERQMLSESFNRRKHKQMRGDGSVYSENNKDRK